MGPEEHGGHCELVFEGPEIPEENVLLGEGLGLKVTPIRLGPARLTHCMRWLGLSKRCFEVARAYAEERTGFNVDRGTYSMPPVQINGARGCSKDTVLEWIYRYARQARLVDGADEVHKMVLNRHLTTEGIDFWQWPVEVEM